MQYTPRGFAVYDQWHDSYGNQITVQESSNIEGGVWVYIKKRGEPKTDWAAHLNDTDVRRLRDALTLALRHQGRRFGPKDDADDH